MIQREGNMLPVTSCPTAHARTSRRPALFFATVVVLLTATLWAQNPPASEDHPESVSQSSAAVEKPQTPTAGAQSPSAHIPIHIVPYGPPTPPTKPSGPAGKSSNNGHVQYWGGPVISNVQVVEVLWGNFVDVPSTTGLEQFFSDVTQSSYLGLLAEYSTAGLTEFGTTTPGSNQTIGLGTFLAPRITISPAMCPGSATNTPCTITDTQIQTEIVSQFNNHHLPAPTQDSQGNFNTIYMIYFPPAVTIIAAPGVNSCQQGGFCAYHSNVTQVSAPKLLYGVFPDFGPTSGCSAAARGCGLGTSQQNLSSASSHELGEAMTDAQVGSFSGSAPAPPLAWVDQFSGEEIGDFCNQDQAQITVNSNTYTVQQQWSNMQNGCVSAPAHFQVSMPTTVIPGRSFNMTVTAQGSIGNFQLGNYNDTVHFTTSDTNTPVIPADYTFVFADAGVHTFPVTLNTIGPQTISAADTTVPGMTGVGSVDVEHNPDLVIASAHTGNFKQGDTGDTYTITVSNTGDKATDGSTVTAVDNLPFGLTATAIAGSGWTCTMPPTLSCTRTDALAAGASYPPITVTVSVSFSAQSSLINFVQVSGGGEANTSNDTASDPTTVIQFPDLVVAKSHQGVWAQGQTGENYTITVTNVGFVLTTAVVTVVDTLPSGLTATNMTGPGWTCNTATVTCTRGDPLFPFGQPYPPITLTVNVALTAPMPNVTNNVVVSGGGEVNTTNDTASDVTTIIPPTSDLIVASSHGAMTQGQAGASYTLTVTNIGSAATNALVKVSDGLPTNAVTATAISGTGWTCDLPSVSCTRSDALAANGATYPPVTITVNVANNAPPTVINNASVSGGGEVNTVNDNTTDNTSITQLPDLTVGISHFGQLAQGQTGQVYIINVSNINSVATNGAVNLVDTLSTGLTATAISGAGWTCTLNNLTCTRSDPSFTFAPIMVTVSVDSNAPSSVTNTATVSGGGEIITTNDTAIDTESVLPPISFSPTGQTATISAGGFAFFNFTISSTPAGTGSISCSAGVPPGAKCTINPSTFVQGSNFITMQVSTTGPTSLGENLSPPARGDRTLPWLSLALLLGVAAITLVRKSRSARLRLALGMAGMAGLLLLLSCGSHGPPPPPPPVVTPPGTYTITVTAANSGANIQGTMQVTLTVH